MSDYTSVSEDFIKQSLSPDMVDSLYSVCYNLSAIIADSNGFIDAGAAQKIILGLDINNPGFIKLGNSISNSGVVDPNYVLPQEEYIPRISYDGYITYLQIKNVDDTLIRDTGVVSSLISNASSIPFLFKTALHALYVDLVALYFNLLSSTKDSGIPGMTKSDVEVCINNSRWISFQVESLDPCPYDLVDTLRDLVRSLYNIHNTSNLFVSSYNSKLSEYQKDLEGMGDE